MKLSAGDGDGLVVRDRGSLALSDAQAVDGELGLGGDTLIQVGGAALDVDLGFLGQAGDGFACEGEGCWFSGRSSGQARPGWHDRV